MFLPIPMAVRSKALVWNRRFAGIFVSNSAGAWMSVCCERFILSGRSFYVGLIASPG